MKRIAKVLCLIALVALIGTSCKKQEEKVTFKATLGELTSDDKVYLLGRQLWFEKDDMVRMFNVKNEVYGQSAMGYYKASSDGLKIDFEADLDYGGLEGDDLNIKDEFFAYFPGEPQMVSGWMPNSGETYGQYGDGNEVPNYVCFSLLPEQEYRTVGDGLAIPKKALYAASKNTSASTIDGADFTFDLIGGVLKLQFYTDLADSLFVDRIEITDSKFNLAGNVFMRIDRVDPVVLTRLCDNYDTTSNLYMQQLRNYIDYVGYRIPGVEEGPTANPNLSKTIALKCTNPVLVSKVKANPTPFMMGLRPLALTYGFSIDVYLHDANNNYHYHRDANAGMAKVTPGKIITFSALKFKAGNLETL